MKSILREVYGIDDRVIDYVFKIKRRCADKIAAMEEVKEYNSLKVLHAFQKVGVEERHFTPSTGYGLADIGREKLCELFAEIFGAEAAIVSPLLASGTHSICMALYGLLRPLDTLLCVTGRPYDTLISSLGLDNENTVGGLAEYAIKYEEIALTPENDIDIDVVLDRLYLDKSIRVVHIQRSKGYTARPALTVAQIGRAAAAIKEKFPDVYVVVDNCYGEFTERQEPTEVGADVIIGSLIKNPGSGIAPTGGYIAGTKRAIDRIAARFTTPTTGMEIGSYAAGYRAFFQGIYLSPSTVFTALVGATLFTEAFSSLGYDVCPKPNEPRSDIAQSITCKSRDELIALIRAIQKASPVDANAVPFPDEQPGYDSPIIMASGSFIQGSTIELSADAPLREPYTAYFQGGLTLESVELALCLALQDMGLTSLL